MKVNDMVTPNFLTLGQAATFTGKSKTTISKALKSGKLSYDEKTASGQYRIEQSELLRVYPKREETGDREHLVTPMVTLEIAALKAKIESQEQMIAHMQSRIDDFEEQRSDLRQQRDKWEQQATSQMRLLEHQTSKRGWLGLLGKNR